jgi:hypothetical protein
MTAKPPISRIVPASMTVLWAVAIVVGSWSMLRHEFAAATPALPVHDLPPELARLVPERKPLTLVLAVHPECPCTAASLEQLERLLAQNPDRIQTIVLFWTDQGEFSAPAVRQSRYWKRLAALPHVTLVPDSDGATAASLGAVVSGSLVAFDAEGRARFHGGLTASRGHAGSSRGLEFLQAIVEGKASPDVCSAPAFGCELQEASGS